LYVQIGDIAWDVVIIQGNNIVGSFTPPSMTWGMAIGKNNHLYISAQDNISMLIDEYDENDNFVRQFRCPGLSYPSQLTVGPNGHVFFTHNTSFSSSNTTSNPI
jgi:hypothetical protein